jgi:hypothetical protein
MIGKHNYIIREGRSTSTALLNVVDDVLAGRDVGQGAILVLLD